MITIVAFVVLLSFMVLVGFGFFSPVWFLLDAGIVYSNQERVNNRVLEEPIIGRSIGDWYMYLLKGYAGISVFFRYYQLVNAYMSGLASVQQNETSIYFSIINALIFIPLVFLIAISSIPAFIILDKTKAKRIEYIRKWANKFEIPENVKIRFEKQNM